MNVKYLHCRFTLSDSDVNKNSLYNIFIFFFFNFMVLNLCIWYTTIINEMNINVIENEKNTLN